MLHFLTIAALLLGTTVVIHSAGATLLVKWFERRATRPRRPTHWFTRPLVLAATAVTLMLLHLVEMAVWALAFFWARPELTVIRDFGSFENFEEAFYFSAVTYTTLGYGDITIADRTWRLMCGLEALNGILLAGWSTAMLFLVVQHLWEIDLGEE